MMREMWLEGELFGKNLMWLGKHRTLHERAPRTYECPYGNKAYHWQTVDVEHLLYNDYDGEKVHYKKNLKNFIEFCLTK